jgi:hypothetical protein
MAGADDWAADGAALCSSEANEGAAAGLDWGCAVFHWVEEVAGAEIAPICMIPPCGSKMKLLHPVYRQELDSCSIVFSIAGPKIFSQCQAGFKQAQQ